VRRCLEPFKPPFQSFNPRTCGRCDPRKDKVAGATIGFNPRTCERCDVLWFHHKVKTECFNPRTCERCDTALEVPLVRLSGFNPRTCERCDGGRKPDRYSHEVSTHAPARGATNKEILTCCHISCFNPRTCERCDLVMLPENGAIHLFQPTHLREVRPVVAIFMMFRTKFQPTHLREVRRLTRSVC